VLSVIVVHGIAPELILCVNLLNPASQSRDTSGSPKRVIIVGFDPFQESLIVGVKPIQPPHQVHKKRIA
jgi:hypothetical protein